MRKEQEGTSQVLFKILLVDGNRDLLRHLEKGLVEEGISEECVLTAESAREAKALFEKHKPSVAVIGYMLPDRNGVELAEEFSRAEPKMAIVVVSGAVLPPEEEGICEDQNFPFLRKPFSVDTLLAAIRKRSR